MIIKTKFNHGDKVWRVIPNKIPQGCPECGRRYPRFLIKGDRIEAVRVNNVFVTVEEKDGKPSIAVRYDTLGGHEGFHGWYPFQMQEAELFATEKEAKNYLAKGGK